MKDAYHCRPHNTAGSEAKGELCRLSPLLLSLPYPPYHSRIEYLLLAYSQYAVNPDGLTLSGHHVAVIIGGIDDGG